MRYTGLPEKPRAYERYWCRERTCPVVVQQTLQGLPSGCTVDHPGPDSVRPFLLEVLSQHSAPGLLLPFRPLQLCHCAFLTLALVLSRSRN